MRIVITGATGFIGRETVRIAQKAGHEVIGLFHKQPPPHNECQWEGCPDLADPHACAKLFQRIGRIDGVIHCAGRASDTGRREAFRRANLQALQTTTQSALQAGAHRIIHISTSDVYGLRDFAGETEAQLPFDTTTREPYPYYKIAAEQWLTKTLPPESYTILRPTAVWGDGDTTLTARFIDFLKASPYVIHFGRHRGQNRWPLAHVNRVATAAVAALDNKQMFGEAYTIIDPTYTTLDRFYQDIIDQTFPEKTFPRLHLPFWSGAIIGHISTALSTLLNTDHPLFDPSYYALKSISANLDFSGEKLQQVNPYPQS